MRAAWLVPIAGVALPAALLSATQTPPSGASPGPVLALAAPAIRPTPPLAAAAVDAGPTHAAEASPLSGLDMLHLSVRDGSVFAPTARGLARLTLDADLQSFAQATLRRYRFPQAAVVVMDVSSGTLLAYVSQTDGGPPRDLCAQALAPSASVFKIVTAAALIEEAHLGPDTKQCYSGGEERIVAANLTSDPRRDRWCTTLAGAFGRSINTVFARLAADHLEPGQLEAMAHRFGYGEPLAFDLPVEESTIRVPDDRLEFARTAAGFWNSTLSPLGAVEMSTTIARDGETVQPVLVRDVTSSSGAVLWSSSPKASILRRAVAPEVAEQIATMMTHTVTEGTSYHAFHDRSGAAFLPAIAVAGKTGTLTDATNHRYYTWFTGFAPLRPSETPQVAIAVLVVNGPTWQVKANVVAREVLRQYFAEHGAAGVTRPGERIARRSHTR
jgi:cell division protein FtsI/penicillin-binding protein 2